jgi:hypothetical protein
VQQKNLFDYLVGASKQRKWHRKPERLGRLEIDDHLDFGDLLLSGGPEPEITQGRPWLRRRGLCGKLRGRLVKDAGATEVHLAMANLALRVQSD